MHRSRDSSRSCCSHTPWAGAANIENGITTDLTNLNQVIVAEDESTVIVGPGNSWHRVYNHVVPEGIVVGGGRVAIVGVGGLVLGGTDTLICFLGSLSTMLISQHQLACRSFRFALGLSAILSDVLR